MRLWLLVLLSAALLAAGASSAFAVPSLGGPTGLIFLPTAEIAPSNLWQFAVGHKTLEVAQFYETLDVSIWGLSALKGVSDDAELFVAYQRITDGDNADAWEYGGKYLISENILPRRGLFGGTKVAVGASLGRWSGAVGMYEGTPVDVETLRAYVVASKQLAPTYTGEWPVDDPMGTRVVGSVGLMYLRVDADFVTAESLLRPFFGVEIIGQRGLTLLAEYRLKDSDLDEDGLFSVGIRKPMGSSTTFEVGLTNGSPIGVAVGNQELYARLTYAVPTEAYQ